MLRGYRFDLHPTAAQAETLSQWVGVVRLVYNLALEQRRDYWRNFQAVEGRSLGWASQSLEITALREQVDWIRAVPRTALEQALRDLDRAYGAFFKGAGYPRFRRLGDDDALRIQGRDVQVRSLNSKWSEVRLPSLGWVRFRATRAVPADRANATFRRTSRGWEVVFSCTSERADLASNNLPTVGIDRGVANAISLSTGEHIKLPSLVAIDRRKRRVQRVLARRRRGSRRYARQRAKLSKITSKIARIRAHHLHVASADIAQRFGVVAVEDLQIGKMTRRGRGVGARQKAGLNRSILAQGWGIFERLLDYKLEAAGGRLVYVPAAYTSQTCQACGVVDRASRKSQAVFSCVHCGYEAHADTNAALEIRRRSTALLSVEGGHVRSPVEAETLAA